ncbi:MAG: sigma-70 family RNA polymerase sigma factor [Bacteroidaceae bacterium]|nr:sigma-70 family RNA polymerase sigma factor [Bacteroidaceae bacterium]
MKKISFRDDVLPLKDKLFRLAFRITLDTAEAEDIVQETLIRVWQNRAKWQEISSIEAYCQIICRRLALDAAGKAGHGNVLLDEHSQQHLLTVTPEEQFDNRERLSLIKQLMDSLPEVQRTIMELRDIEGLSYQQISNVMDLTEVQVKVYLHRARTKIKNKVEEFERYEL